MLFQRHKKVILVVFIIFSFALISFHLNHKSLPSTQTFSHVETKQQRFKPMSHWTRTDISTGTEDHFRNTKIVSKHGIESSKHAPNLGRLYVDNEEQNLKVLSINKTVEQAYTSAYTSVALKSKNQNFSLNKETTGHDFNNTQRTWVDSNPKKESAKEGYNDIISDNKTKVVSHNERSMTSNQTSGNLISKVKHSIPLNCTLLADKNTDEWQKAQTLLKEMPYLAKTENDYIKLTENCDDFIHQRGYHSEPLSQEEIDFPLAFGIRIHHNIEQFERLLRLIYMPQNIYCIYIDLKSTSLFHQAVNSIVNCLPNVFIASRLKIYVYASFSAVEADMQCMRDLLNSKVKWRYFLNLAGTELPLKTNLEIVTILKLLNGTNDIEQYPFRGYQHRYKQMHYVSGTQMVMSNQQKEDFHKNMTFYKGSAYNSFSRKYVEWILTDPLAQNFIEWTRDTYSPDETVWGSLNLWPDAPGGYPFMVTQTSKTFLSREVIWTYSAAYCYGQYVRGICMLGFTELPWLKRRWEFFANKFDISLDHIGYHCIEEWHRTRTAKPEIEHAINWGVVNKLPQIKYARQQGNR